MTVEEFKKIYVKYNPILAPIISNIITNNYNFFHIKEKIKWKFGYSDDIKLMGNCDNKTSLLSFNILSIIDAYENDTWEDVEFFIVHEIRHIVQNIMIKIYENGGKSNGVNSQIEKWIYEKQHYLSATDGFGNDNEQYYYQSIEKDANAFACAVMKYKYGEFNIPILSFYDDDFFEYVNILIEQFKQEKL